MAGIIYHLIAGIILAVIVFYKFRKWDYSAAVFIGNFLHDIFAATYIPFLIKTFNPMQIIYSSYFAHRDTVFNVIWLVIQSMFVLVFLFFQKYVRKKEFKEFEYNVGFLLLGIIVHAIMDLTIQEQGIWI